MKKRILLVAYIAIALCHSLWAAEPNFQDMLRRVDFLVSFESTDFSAEYTIVQDKPGSGRTTTVAAIFRRDKAKTFLILVMDPPADKGKGYLKIDDGLWFYDASSRKFSFTDAKERFQNSNARNSDFTHSNFSGDYRVKAAKKEMLGKFDCWVLDLEAVTAEVPVPVVKLWIDADNLVRKSVDFSLSGQVLRTTAIPSYQKVGNRFVPMSMVIVDNLRGKTVDGKFINEQTRISVAKPSLDPLPDALFTKAWLEKMGR